MYDANRAVRERILELCQERDLTLHKLCAVSGITWSTIDNIISGHTKSTTISTIQKICDGLEITLQTFFDSDRFYRQK